MRYIRASVMTADQPAHQSHFLHGFCLNFSMNLCTMQSVEQLAFADVVVINKTDLVTDKEKTALKQRIKVLHKNLICIIIL